MRDKRVRVFGWFAALVLGVGMAAAAWAGLPVFGGTGTAAFVAAGASSTFALEVDVSERRLYVKEYGEVVRSFPVAVGRPGNPTPRGSFRVRHMIWNPRWVPPDAAWAREKTAKAPGDPRNPMGRVKIFFREPDYYIHGTREVDSLGQAESRGCIRMRNSDVVSLARLVMSKGGTPRDPSWFRRVLNRVTRSQEVYLERSIPFTVRS
ncbi:MAG: L,D-transpeptidase [Gemmatimonadetes bacterium]|nr:L,D-transpeptidase [Gemmatimonadota bacterium]